jgi:DNA-directed RNA polymerase specialized sigma subunit
MEIHIKGDERILGDSDFVEKVLSQASKQMERRYRLKAEGWTLTKIAERVRARGVLAYWAIRDPGLTATEVGTYLGLSKSAVSRAATRGQKLIVDQFLSLKD